MRVPSRPAGSSLGFNMTPMIDVVFLLIIFFLVSSHLARQETQLQLDLPRAASGQRPDGDDVRRVVVNILPDRRPDGRIQVGGRLLSRGELRDLIDYEAQQAQGRLEVRIRCDRRVPYQMAEPVMVACALSNVWKVTFAVVER